MDYQQILTTVAAASQIPIAYGETIVFIWNNLEHLQEWVSCKKSNSGSIRIARLPSFFMSMLDTGNHRREDVCILAIGLGTQEDYSDTRCLFHMVIKEN